MTVPAPLKDAIMQVAIERARRGAVVDPAHRLFVTHDGRLIRLNYHLGPFSHH